MKKKTKIDPSKIIIVKPLMIYEHKSKPEPRKDYETIDLHSKN